MTAPFAPHAVLAALACTCTCACPCTSPPAGACLGRYPAPSGLAGLGLGFADCAASVTPNFQPPEHLRRKQNLHPRALPVSSCAAVPVYAL
eukprot:scaffold93711_cov72-Phaeocystis_antarctica.AAC.2